MADQLHLQAPWRKEIQDRLPGRGTLGDRDRPLQRLDVLGLQVFCGLIDVVDIERNMVQPGDAS